mmetsp:Transcript_6531/g.10464  ORF Transcript_6531/g.10464 Transcript_6531/m.10464 type:complete len:230 (-) Transcript_6531:162-851(-)
MELAMLCRHFRIHIFLGWCRIQSRNCWRRGSCYNLPWLGRDPAHGVGAFADVLGHCIAVFDVLRMEGKAMLSRDGNLWHCAISFVVSNHSCLILSVAALGAHHARIIHDEHGCCAQVSSRSNPSLRCCSGMYGMWLLSRVPRCHAGSSGHLRHHVLCDGIAISDVSIGSDLPGIPRADEEGHLFGIEHSCCGVWSCAIALVSRSRQENSVRRGHIRSSRWSRRIILGKH